MWKARSLHVLQGGHEPEWVPAAGLANAASVALTVELAHRLVDAAHHAGLERRSAGLAEEAHLRIPGVAGDHEKLNARLAGLALLADLGARRWSPHGAGV